MQLCEDKLALAVTHLFQMERAVTDRTHCNVRVMGGRPSYDVEESLTRICAKTGQPIDINAQAALAALGETAAISVCNQVLKSPTPVRSASKLICHLAQQRMRLAQVVSQMLSEVPDSDFESLEANGSIGMTNVASQMVSEVPESQFESLETNESIRMANVVSQMVSEVSDSDLERLAEGLEQSPSMGLLLGSGAATVSSATRTPEPVAAHKRKLGPQSNLHERSVRVRPEQQASVARRLEMRPAGDNWIAFGELPFIKRQLILKYYHP